jgi:hypothetical protein
MAKILCATEAQRSDGKHATHGAGVSYSQVLGELALSLLDHIRLKVLGAPLLAR